MNRDLEHQPLDFEGSSNKKSSLQASDFRGKVPMAVTFVGAPDGQNDEIIIKLNDSLLRFGQRRVQLLLVVDGDPALVSERLHLKVPLVADEGLAAELGAERSNGEPVVSIILGNDGMVLDVVRQLPADDQAAAILVAIDRLVLEYPDRFQVLPTHPSVDAGDAKLTELIADPTTLDTVLTDPLP
jgi:peroxiredoxin